MTPEDYKKLTLKEQIVHIRESLAREAIERRPSHIEKLNSLGYPHVVWFDDNFVGNNWGDFQAIIKDVAVEHCWCSVGDIRYMGFKDPRIAIYLKMVYGGDK